MGKKSKEEVEKELKQEAIERLKILEKKFGLLPTIRKEFETDNTLYYADYGGILYWVHNEEKYVKAVQEFEKKHNAKVYFCLVTHAEFGELLDMFYVSSDKTEWEIDREELETGLQLIYCKNFDEELFSEFGSISFRGIHGGLMRVR